MLRLALSSFQSRVRASAFLAIPARMSSSAVAGSGGAGTTSGNGSPPAEKPSAAPTAETPQTPEVTAPPEASAKYEFRPEEVLNAVRSGDIAKIQTTATTLVQHKWKEEYTFPAACLVVFTILWYWVAWTRRSVRRKCAATEAAVRLEAQETVDKMRNLTERWGKDIAKSDEQMKVIIEKNSALTADVDRMTTALRSCSIRPTPFSAARNTSKPAAAEPQTPTLPVAASADTPAP